MASQKSFILKGGGRHQMICRCWNTHSSWLAEKTGCTLIPLSESDQVNDSVLTSLKDNLWIICRMQALSEEVFLWLPRHCLPGYICLNSWVHLQSGDSNLSFSIARNSSSSTASRPFSSSTWMGLDKSKKQHIHLFCATATLSLHMNFRATVR